MVAIFILGDCGNIKVFLILEPICFELFTGCCDSEFFNIYIIYILICCVCLDVISFSNFNFLYGTIDSQMICILYWAFG
jgi:hypothetical protein